MNERPRNGDGLPRGGGDLPSVREDDDLAGGREDGARPSGRELMRREFLSYVAGVILALILTLVPFGLVEFGHLPLRTVYFVIGCLAFVQGIVHFRFFLHIGFRQKREDLQLILFAALLLFIMIGGTVWIMTDLSGRMMLPLHP